MNGWDLVPGYKYIGTKEDVCGGDPTIVGTRLEPIFIASYGPDAIEDFGITQEQYDEAVSYHKRYVIGKYDGLNCEIQRLRAALGHIHTIAQSELDDLQYEGQRKTWEEILLTVEDALKGDGNDA